MRNLIRELCTFSTNVNSTKDAFFREAKDIIRLAETEGLGAHADSVRVRLKENLNIFKKRKSN